MLVVLFHVGQPEPQLQFVDGFLPLFFDTYEECEARRKTSTDYFMSQDAFPPFIMNCYVREAPGTDS